MTRTLWHFVDRALSSTTTVYAACAASLALGLAFIFVWSPLPWGWQGIDFYYEIALSLARGEPFPTMHLVWGYAYFLAFWYWLFGDHQWVPLTAQAVLNATIPLMLYHLVRIELGARFGVMAAVLAGLLSFNTIYTSTQASDSVCTVLVLATMLCLSAGRSRRRPALFVPGRGSCRCLIPVPAELRAVPVFLRGAVSAASAEGRLASTNRTAARQPWRLASAK